MKKITIMLMLLLLCMANVQASSANIKEYVEYSSGEKDDGSIYLDSYEDYEKILKNVDEQELYKTAYEQMIKEQIESFRKSTRTQTVKARVLETKSVEEYYSNDSSGSYKIKYQPLKVQILEGEYAGQTVEVSYILTADTYENIKVPSVRENQNINVILQESNGELYAYATTIDAAVDRSGYVITLSIITIFILLVSLGKSGLKVLAPLALLADLAILVFAPSILAGKSILWLAIITSILYIFVTAVLKNGLKSKIIPAILTSILVTLVLTVLLAVFGNIANLCGITYEITSMIEVFPNGTIDFYILYLSSFILMSAITTIDVACEEIKIYEENGNKNAKKMLKEYTANKIPAVIGILLVMIIPKYIYIFMSKYGFAEIINSEMLLTDIIRILFLTIAITITKEVSEIMRKIFIEWFLLQY